MGLAALFNVPGNKDELATWAFSHMADHRDIIRAIQQRTGQSLTEFSLDPIPINNLNAWLYQHQIMHNEMNAVFGLSGFNLSNVNIQDDDSLSGFILANGIEHRQMNEILAQNPALTSNATFTGSNSGSFFTGTASLNVAFGAADNARYLLAAIGYATDGVNPPAGVLASPSIGGVSATILAQAANVFTPATPFNYINVGTMLCVAYVPTGTSGLVTASITGGGSGQTIARMACSVYQIIGISSTTPTQVLTSPVANPNGTFDIAAQKCIVGVANSGITVGGSSATWVGLGEDSDFTYGGGPGTILTFSAASLNTSAAVAGLLAQCTFGSAPTGTGCFVVF